MESLRLRKKLILQFDHIIKDDDKLIALEGILDALDSQNTESNIPNEHYDIIKESRDLYLSGKLTGLDWEEIKQNLMSKYGL